MYYTELERGTVIEVFATLLNPELLSVSDPFPSSHHYLQTEVRSTSLSAWRENRWSGTDTEEKQKWRGNEKKIKNEGEMEGENENLERKVRLSRIIYRYSRFKLGASYHTRGKRSQCFSAQIPFTPSASLRYGRLPKQYCSVILHSTMSLPPPTNLSKPPRIWRNK